MKQDYVLPLVDISKLTSPQLEERLQVAQELDQACREVGFLYIRGDQLQPALFQQLDLHCTQLQLDGSQKRQNLLLQF